MAIIYGPALASHVYPSAYEGGAQQEIEDGTAACAYCYLRITTYPAVLLPVYGGLLYLHRGCVSAFVRDLLRDAATLDGHGNEEPER